MAPSTFISNTDSDRDSMLKAIGVAGFDELVRDIPGEHLYPALDLPPSAPEPDLANEISALAAANRVPGDYACFLGAGAYRHFVPAAARQVASRGEFVTSYTPYQPEVAQGSLQVAFEFQTMVSLLYGMEVSNAGMYDGPTAFAEAALMACRITRRNRVAILDSVDPRHVAVVRSYSEHQGIELTLTPAASFSVPDDAACLMIQSPNMLGEIEDMSRLTTAAHDAGALAITSVNPIAMGLFKAPGECDIDIATGEGQPLGVPLGYGGPYVGLFACKDSHKRQMPGRIVGKTTDTRGRTGYVLTLQTREQHIRRERATSNICTSTQLIALMVTAYVAAMGKQGIKETAELCYHKAHYAAQQIDALPGYSLSTSNTFFNEFVIACPRTASETNSALLEAGIIGGLNVSDRVPNGILFSVTEVNTRQEIDSLVSALAGIASSTGEGAQA